MKRVTFGFAALVVLFGVGQASGAIATYEGTDIGVGPGGARPNSDAAAASFDAAAGALAPIIDFEGLSIGNFTSRVVAPGVTVTLTGTASDADAGITNVTGDQIVGYNTTSGGSQHLRFVPEWDIGTATATYDFAVPIQAFGLYLTGLGTAAGNLHVSFFDGSSQDLSVVGDPSGGVKFFGLTDLGAQIAQVSLELRGVTSVSRDIFGMDDVRYSVIPEPSTLAIWSLLGTLGLTVGWWRRKPRAG